MKRGADGSWRKVASRCRSRTCPSCGVLWAGDVRIKLLRNIEAYGGDVGLVTITAPGANVLPHLDTETGELVGPGDARGAMVLPDAAREWNLAAPANFTAMHKRAAQRARRHAKRSGGSWQTIAREWEYQRRGVLHVHVVVPMGTPLERMASHRYLDSLEELRGEYGFGFVDGGKGARHGLWKKALDVVPQQRAARYLAKYVAGVKADGRLALSETVSRRDVPAHVVYVGRHLTRRTGCTMRSLRVRRHAHVLYERAVAEGLPPHVFADLDDEHLVEVLGPILGRAP